MTKFCSLLYSVTVGLDRHLQAHAPGAQIAGRPQCDGAAAGSLMYELPYYAGDNGHDRVALTTTNVGASHCQYCGRIGVGLPYGFPPNYSLLGGKLYRPVDGRGRADCEGYAPNLLPPDEGDAFRPGPDDDGAPGDGAQRRRSRERTAEQQRREHHERVRRRQSQSQERRDISPSAFSRPVHRHLPQSSSLVYGPVVGIRGRRGSWDRNERRGRFRPYEPRPRPRNRRSKSPEFQRGPRGQRDRNERLRLRTRDGRVPGEAELEAPQPADKQQPPRHGKTKSKRSRRKHQPGSPTTSTRPRTSQRVHSMPGKDSRDDRQGHKGAPATHEPHSRPQEGIAGTAPRERSAGHGRARGVVRARRLPHVPGPTHPVTEAADGDSEHVTISDDGLEVPSGAGTDSNAEAGVGEPEEAGMDEQGHDDGQADCDRQANDIVAEAVAAAGVPNPDDDLLDDSLLE